MSGIEEPSKNINKATSNQGDDKLDALATHLSDSLSARTPLLSHNKRMCLWVALSTVSFALLVLWVFPLRGDMNTALMHGSLPFELGLAGLITLSSIWAATCLMVPVAKEDVFKIVRVPLVLGGLFVIWSVFKTYEAMMGGHMAHELGVRPCFWWGFVVSVMPIICAVYLAKRGASTNPRWLHTMSFMAIFAFGWIGLRLICGWDAAGHAFLFHFTPFVILGALSGLVSAKLFKTI
jgi:hypothetical protein